VPSSTTRTTPDQTQSVDVSETRVSAPGLRQSLVRPVQWNLDFTERYRRSERRLRHRCKKRSNKKTLKNVKSDKNKNVCKRNKKRYLFLVYSTPLLMPKKWPSRPSHNASNIVYKQKFIGRHFRSFDMQQKNRRPISLLLF